MKKCGFRSDDPNFGYHNNCKTLNLFKISRTITGGSGSRRLTFGGLCVIIILYNYMICVNISIFRALKGAVSNVRQEI